MARFIDGAASSGWDFAPGALNGANSTGNALTFAALVKKTGANGTFTGLLGLSTATSVDVGMLSVNNNGTSADSVEWTVNNFVSWNTSVKLTSADGWALIVGSRAAGAGSVVPRLHKYVYSTNTWTRANATAGLSGVATAATGYWTGYGTSAAHYAVQGSWNRVLTDAEIDRLPYSLSAWFGSAPSGLWVLDQGNTAMLINDLTGGGAHQNYIQGTVAVSTDAVPVFGYGHEVMRATRTAPAAVAYRASSAASAVATATSTNITIPSAVQIGDMMIAVVSYKALTGSALVTPAGWEAIQGPVNGPSGNTFQGAVYTRVCASGDPTSSVTFGGPSSVQINVAFAAYANASGVLRSSSFVVGSTTASTSITATAASPAPQAGDLVVLVGAVRGATNGPANAPTFTGPGGATIRAQSANTSGSAQNTAAFIGDHNATAGDRTVTASGTAWAIAGQVILKQGASTAVNSDFAEGLTLADSYGVATQLVVGVAEGLGLGDGFGASVMSGRAIGESMSLVDAVSRTVLIARGLGEALALSDAAARNVARLSALADGLGLADTMSRSAAPQARSLAEMFTAGDAVGHAVNRPRALAETLQVANVVTRAATAGRGQAETLTAGDSMARTTARARATGEGLGLADAMARSNGRLAGTAESLTSSGVLGYTVSRSVAAADSVAVANAVGRQAGYARGAAEAVTIADGVITGLGVMVSTGEALPLADTWARQVSAPRAVTGGLSFDDDLLVGVSLVAAAGVGLELVDAEQAGRVVLVGASETLDSSTFSERSFSGGAAVGEALAIGQGLARLVVRDRGVAEALGLVDSFGAGQSVSSGVAQSLTLGHTFGRSATTYGRSAPQTLTLADAVARAATAYARTVTQTLGLAEALQSGKVMLIGVAELVDLDDAVDRVHAVGRVAAEAVLLGNTIGRSAIAWARGAGDVFGLADTAQSGRVVAASFSEDMPIGDSWVRAQSGSRGAAEAMVLGHLVARAVARSRAYAEAVQLADGWLAQRQIIPVAVAGEIAFSESTVAKVATSRGSGNGLVLAQTAGRGIDRGRAVPQSLTLAELVLAIRGQSIVADAQPMTLDDIGRASTSRRIAVSETMLIFSTGGAGDQDGNPIVIAHTGRVEMTQKPRGRVRMTRSPHGVIRMTEGG